MSDVYSVRRRRWAARRLVVSRWFAMPRTRIEFGAPLCEIDADGRREVLVNDDAQRRPWGIYWHCVDIDQEIPPEARLFEYSDDGRVLKEQPTYDVRERQLPLRRRDSYPPVFLSYRRAEAEESAEALYDTLRPVIGGRDPVFLDRASIRPGEPFPWAVQQAAAHCQVMAVIVGPTWLAADGEGRRRIDVDHDYVRREVTAGLDRGIAVVPVFLDGTTPPTDRELPHEMRGFESLHRRPLRRDSWQDDLDQLVAAIRQNLH